MNPEIDQLEEDAAEAGARAGSAAGPQPGGRVGGSNGVHPRRFTRRERILGRLGIGKAADDTIRAHTMRGSIITLMDFGFRQVLSLASNLMLAYLLAPSVFGLMALVMVLIRGLRLFSDVGIGPSIIHHKRGDDPVFLNTAWTIQTMRGWGLWLGSCILAWPAAWAYGVPQLVYLLPIVALTSALGGFNSTSVFTLPRSMKWAPMVILGLTAQVACTATMVVMAWWLKSVWAIIAGTYVQCLIMLIGSHMVGKPHKHRFTWEREAAHELLKFGRWVFLSSVLTFFATQLDRLVLGRLLTLDELGVYSLALTVAMIPGTVCGQLAVAVLFPALATSARERPAEFASKIRAARNVILPGGLVATLGVVLGAPVLFLYLYKTQYHDAAWMCQALSLSAWFAILQMSADRAVLALGNSKSLALCNAVKLVVTVGAALGGHYLFGLLGFMGGMAAGTLVSHAMVAWTLWQKNVRLVDQDLVYTALALALGGAGAGVPYLFPYAQGTREYLFVLLGTGALVLAPLGLWAARRIVREVFGR